VALINGGGADTEDRIGPSGTTYQIEVEAFWDDEEGGNLRVCVAIDGGEVSAYRPISSDFIIAPDGSFVGESEQDAHADS
jgi:hypothetical protein